METNEFILTQDELKELIKETIKDMIKSKLKIIIEESVDIEEVLNLNYSNLWDELKWLFIK